MIIRGMLHLTLLWTMTLHGCLRFAADPREPGKDLGPLDRPPTVDSAVDLPRIDESPLSRSIELAITPQKIGSSTIVYDGAAFALVWEAIPEDTRQRSLFFARVSFDGEMLIEPTMITPLDFNIILLRLFSLADGYRVWFSGLENKTAVYTQKISPSGLAQDQLRTVVSFNASSTHGKMSVAFDGASFGLVWENKVKIDEHYYPQIHYSLVDLTLQALVPPRALTPKAVGQRTPYIGWQGKAPGEGAFVATWEEQEKIQIALIKGAEATFLAGPQVLIDTEEVQKDPQGVSLDQDSTLLWWNMNRSFYYPVFLPITGLTPHLNAPLRLLPENRLESVDLAVARVESRLLFAWQSNAHTSLPQILIREYNTANLQQLPGTSLTLTNNRYSFSDPQAAGSPAGFGVIFKGNVEGQQRLYFRGIP